MICRLREIAKAKTESQFQKRVDALKCRTIWKNKLKLQQWFDRVWLAHHKRWVSLFRLNMFNIRVTTSNGLERQLLSLSKIILQTQVTNHCPILLMCYLLKSSRTAIKPGLFFKNPKVSEEQTKENDKSSNT